MSLTVIELFPEGTDFDALDKCGYLNRTTNEISMNITLATLSLKSGSKTMFQVNAPVYLANQGEYCSSSFAPMLTLERGGTYSVHLTNNLVQNNRGSDIQNYIGDTSFHVHGLHVQTGVYNLSERRKFVGGDNPMASVKGRAYEGTETVTTTHFFGSLPTDHMPGFHWFHPHKHFSTSTQVFASHGSIIVKGDDEWLPDTNGCGPVRNAINSAERKILQFTSYFMAPAANWGKANYQMIMEKSNSTYCCNDGEQGLPDSFWGTSINKDIVVVNGGYKPMLQVKSLKWYRLSMVHASYRNSLVLQILDKDTQLPTQKCEMKLIAKDGVYMMKIPRTVEYLVVPSGGRVEALIRCNASAGEEFDVTSNATGILGNPAKNPASVVQQKLLTISVTEKTDEDGDLADKACTPLRASYAADLRDAALSKHGVTPMVDERPTFSQQGGNLGCTMSGQNFSSTQVPYDLEIGKVIEWQFAGLSGHPLHLHINPYQIVNQSLKDGAILGGFYEEGDFHDTLINYQAKFTQWDDKSVRTAVRMNPGPYYGYTVVHCHFLMHEDAGCMHMVNYVCPAGAKKDTMMPFKCHQKLAVPGTFESGGGGASNAARGSTSLLVCVAMCIARIVHMIAVKH